MLSKRELNDVRVIIEDMQIRNDPNWIFIDQLLQDFLRLRDALRPFADAWLTVSFPDEVECRLATVSKGKIIHMLVHEDGWLHASALRAAYLALHPDDTGGEDDD